MDLCKNVDVREHAFFGGKKKQKAGYRAPLGYQYNTSGGGNDLPDLKLTQKIFNISLI